MCSVKRAIQESSSVKQKVLFSVCFSCAGTHLSRPTGSSCWSLLLLHLFLHAPLQRVTLCMHEWVNPPHPHMSVSKHVCFLNNECLICLEFLVHCLHMDLVIINYSIWSSSESCIYIHSEKNKSNNLWRFILVSYFADYILQPISTSISLTNSCSSTVAYIRYGAYHPGNCYCY